MPTSFSPFMQPLIILTLLLKCFLNLGEGPSQPELFPIFAATNRF